MGQPLERIAKQYEIVAKIREGGMGEIYQVRHRLLDEVRVVKVLRSRYTSDVKLGARFAQEARAAIQLRHPNIVQIFDFTLDDTGAGLIVMEYIRGADLKHFIGQSRPPSLPLALEIGRQSLRALGFLHRHGFVHRDVSPDNLMLTEDVDGRPLVKLIDLGIAKRLDSDRHLTTSGMFLGKYRYASPEHFGDRGTEDVEARSDLYAFGLVFYELVTGRYPLPGEGTAQMVAGHLYKQPLGFAETDPDGRVPEVLRRALLRSLAKDPGERFATARDFIAEIEMLQRAHPVDQECCEEARRLVASEPVEARWQPPGSTGERLNRSEEKKRREEAKRRIAELVRRAGIAFEGERFAEAADDLRQASKLAPDDSWIRDRRVQAEVQQQQLEEKRRRQAEASSYLRQAEEAEGRRDILRARLLVAQALELDPESPIARARAMDLDRRPIEPVLTRSAAAAANRIEEQKGSGETLAAWRSVQAAVEEFGDIEPFTNLRKEIAEKLLDGETA